MHYETDVRLVDSHAERIGGHHDPSVAVHEFFLIFAAHLFGQPSVVERHAVIRCPEGAHQLFRGFDRGDINDPAALALLN